METSGRSESAPGTPRTGNKTRPRWRRERSPCTPRPRAAAPPARFGNCPGTRGPKRCRRKSRPAARRCGLPDAATESPVPRPRKPVASRSAGAGRRLPANCRQPRPDPNCAGKRRLTRLERFAPDAEWSDGPNPQAHEASRLLLDPPRSRLGGRRTPPSGPRPSIRLSPPDCRYIPGSLHWRVETSGTDIRDQVRRRQVVGAGRRPSRNRYRAPWRSRKRSPAPATRRATIAIPGYWKTMTPPWTPQPLYLESVSRAWGSSGGYGNRTNPALEAGASRAMGMREPSPIRPLGATIEGGQERRPSSIIV